MRLFTRLEFLQFLSTTFSSTFLIGCDSREDPKPDNNRIQLREISVPAEFNVIAQGDITLSGKGFADGDKFRLVLTSDAGQSYTIDLLSFDEASATFTLPESFTAGQYRIILVRGSEELTLGTTRINIVVKSNLRDKPGMTVKGLVYSNGVGLPGVVVADGYAVTTTDENGVYYLPSEKKTGFVFISVPANYEVPVEDNIPQFFKRLGGATTVEQKDFSLTPTTNTKHAVVAIADWHLANRNDDLSQFASGFLPDVNALTNEYATANTKVYGLALGDGSWDAYWYENNFALIEYKAEMKKVNCPMFNVIGNHDNDPYVTNAWEAKKKYRDVIGPTYYSFNLGEVHYVVLDNIQYINTGGGPGVIGQRNYNDVISPEQLEWLKKDLATLQDKTAPVIIAMHAPLHRAPALNESGEQVDSLSLNNGAALISAMEGFSEVYVVTGHIHTNYTAKANAAITEFNVGAVCATWWWTGRSGYANNHICKDGSPGGYGVFEIEGRNVKWYYKSIGKPRSYQFRSYDLNKVHITAAAFAPNSTDGLLEEYAGAYSIASSNNEVLINVWGFGPGWTIEVSESGGNLPVTRVQGLDPLHIISYDAKRLNAGAVPTSAFVTDPTAHLFKVVASGATSPIEIKVTDVYGNVYTETMERPKEFTYTSH
ncbi:MAG: calcineurin-like phosphoesterase family protein [Bacteroidota bacterium]|nr:calcineurin-like phosphoesterase family protein [Bacteroidota bacterium]